MKNEKKVFGFSYSKNMASVSLELFVEHKPWNCEEWQMLSEHHAQSVIGEKNKHFRQLGRRWLNQYYSGPFCKKFSPAKHSVMMLILPPIPNDRKIFQQHILKVWVQKLDMLDQKNSLMQLLLYVLWNIIRYRAHVFK